MIVMAEPIVRLLFEYGKFDAADTARTAHVLRFYGLGLWAFCAQHIVLRAFFSTGDVKTPLRISCAVLPLNVALTLTLVWVDSLREAAFAVSTSISSALTVVVGIVLLQRRAHVAILDARTWRALAAMLAAAALSAVTVAWLRSLWLPGLPALGGPVFVARAIDTLGGLTLGCAFYALLTRLLGLEEIRLALRRHRPPSS
jgi:putative peptidoglycan lipid II flippase